KEDTYRWFVLFGGFLAQAISMCTLSSWVCLYVCILGIMQDYYDRQVFQGSVDSTLLSFVGTLGMSFCGLMGPVTPVLISLVGAKWLLFFGSVLMTSGLILASFSTKIWQLYITQSIMHGIGAALLYIVSMSISPQWFTQRRGLAMGIMVSGSGLGGLIMPFIMTHLNESLGGAWCYRILGIITFVVSLTSTLLLKENSEMKMPSKGFKNMIDTSLCKDKTFLIWCLSGNLSMLGYFIPAFYLPSHATKIGLRPSQGSILVASFSAVNVVGRIMSGYMGDHIGVMNVNVIFLFICGLSSLLIWTFADSFMTLLIFILVYGFMSGSVFSLFCLYLFFMTASRFGPSLAGAVQTATDKNSFFSQEMFTGIAFILSSLVTIVLKLKMNPNVMAKI
ncbi:major facilitator superfamily domain-containing protein, partial [Sporodiniella umbellata]